ncbi:MAG: hypothetical protein PSX42_05170 [bacterium]|nr:hypothetical protein [bacterium]
MKTHSEHISGRKTAEDWKMMKRELQLNSTPAVWNKAFEEFFYTRLSLRYLDPINKLQKSDDHNGEGFSIVSIQCSIIEFLESTFQGSIYRYIRDGGKLGDNEYSSSSKIFQSFLTKRQPFSGQFHKDIAQDFYIGVRCALLHEARTRRGWRIRAKDSNSRIIDIKEKIIYRNNFQIGLIKFINDYKHDLIISTELQSAFIRKFDNLCE